MPSHPKATAVNDLKTVLTWAYAGCFAILSTIAQCATSIEPDSLIWMLGFAGALFGAAGLPSAGIRSTAAKFFMGLVISGVASTPVAGAHVLPAFFNVHLVALYLGFAGPAIFMASASGNAVLNRFLNKEKSA